MDYISMQWIRENFKGSIFTTSIKSVKIGALEMLFSLEKEGIIATTVDVKEEYRNLTRIN